MGISLELISFKKQSKELDMVYTGLPAFLLKLLKPSGMGSSNDERAETIYR